MAMKSSLTILFENPFWIGLFERIDGNKYEVCKITFGAEPMNLWETSQLIGSVCLKDKYLVVDFRTYCDSLFLHLIQLFVERYCHEYRYDCGKHIGNRLGIHYSL